MGHFRIKSPIKVNTGFKREGLFGFFGEPYIVVCMRKGYSL